MDIINIAGIIFMLIRYGSVYHYGYDVYPQLLTFCRHIFLYVHSSVRVFYDVVHLDSYGQ